MQFAHCLVTPTIIYFSSPNILLIGSEYPMKILLSLEQETLCRMRVCFLMSSSLTGSLLIFFVRGMGTSVAFLAEISLRSPRKIIVFIIYKKYEQDQSIQKIINLISKKTSLMGTLTAFVLCRSLSWGPSHRKQYRRTMLSCKCLTAPVPSK